MTTIIDTKKKFKSRIVQIQEDFNKRENEKKLIEEKTQDLLKIDSCSKIKSYHIFSTHATEYLFNQIDEYNNYTNELKKIIDNAYSYYEILKNLENDNVFDGSAVYIDIISSAIENFSKYDIIYQERLCFIETYEQIKNKCSQLYDKYCVNENNVDDHEQNQEKAEQEKKQEEQKNDTFDVFSDGEDEQNEKSSLLKNDDKNDKKPSLLKEREYNIMDYDVI
jgi:hypothetical protein